MGTFGRYVAEVCRHGWQLSQRLVSLGDSVSTFVQAGGAIFAATLSWAALGFSKPDLGPAIVIGLVAWGIVAFVFIGPYRAWKAKDLRVRELEDALFPSVETEFSQPESGQWRLTITNTSDRQIENCQVLLRSLTEIRTGRVIRMGEAFIEVADGSTRFPVPPRGHATVVIMGLTMPRSSHEIPRLNIGGDRARNTREIAGANADIPLKLDILIQATNLEPKPLQLVYDGAGWPL